MASAREKTKNAGLVLEDFLPYRLSILANRVSRAIARRYAEEFDLTIPEWRVMAILGRQVGLSARDICEAAEMDKVAISRAVARLAEAGRVRASADSADARRQILSLTREGQRIYARIAPVALECERQLIAALTSGERNLLDRLLVRLSEASRAL